MRIRLVAAVVLVLTIARPGSAIISDRPERTWGTNGRVYAAIQIGNRIYIGGDFSAAVAPDGSAVSRNDLMAIYADTGTLVADFRPQPSSSSIRTLAASPDGTMLYVGGGFSSIGGAARRNLAAINPSTGSALSGWRADTNGRVNSLAVANGRLYTGGWFTTMTNAGSTQNRSYVGAVAIADGRVDTSWAPVVGNSTEDFPVRAVALSADGGRVFIGGNFLSLNGLTDRRRLVAVNAFNGALDTTFRPGVPEVYDIAADADRVYVALGGPGGEARALDAATGAVRWYQHGDGDFQGIGLFDGALYVGGHFDNVADQLHKKLFAVNPATGSIYAFAPTVNSALGVFAVTAGSGALLVGGDFTAISGVAQRHFAKFQ
ncbi:MAG: PQQ-binding-like beta-propeller repeat protein [Gaiellales bacterium]